jgi:hypothetical protein
MSLLGGFCKYRNPSFYTSLQWTTYICNGYFFWGGAEKCVHRMLQVGRSRQNLPAPPTIPVSGHMPSINHTQAAVLLIHKFHPFRPVLFVLVMAQPNMRKWLWEVLIDQGSNGSMGLAAELEMIKGFEGGK